MELKFPPVVLGLACVLFMWVASVLAPWADFRLPATDWVAGALYGLGLAIISIGVHTFRRAQTTIDPRTPEKTSQLVTHGIYNRTRNPMYLGFTIMLLGVAVHLGNYLAFAVLPLFSFLLTRLQIIPEERNMRAIFGDQYEAYVARVRRWM